MPGFNAKLKEGKSQGIVSELLEPAAKPLNKGGRPKGLPKTKKTFYLATDLALLEQIRVDLARHAGFVPKDESDTVDLALEVLAAIAATTEYTAIINKVNKNRLKR